MKLVRDKIPGRIEKSGSTCKYHKAGSEEYKSRLYDKLREELAEFIETPCYEEAADIYEVFYAICEFHNMSMLKVEVEAVNKRERSGGFNDRIILDSVANDEESSSDDPWVGFDNIPSGF